MNDCQLLGVVTLFAVSVRMPAHTSVSCQFVVSPDSASQSHKRSAATANDIHAAA